MSKGARIKQLRAEGTDRRHTLVTKETNPRKMNNPANATKARELIKAKTKEKNPIIRAIAGIR